METFEELQELFNTIFSEAFNRNKEDVSSAETKNDKGKFDVDENLITVKEGRIKDLERENKQLKEKVIVLNRQSQRNYKRYINALDKLNRIKDILKGGDI